jgi:signal peptidase I
MLADWKVKLQKWWRGWGYSLLVALLIATSFKSAIADWNDVPTGSMTPTILAGDRIFVNKLAYDLKVPYTTLRLARWANPERGDIVVFYSPQNGQRLVKRVVGLPGDTLAMVRNRLIINNKPQSYAWVELPGAVQDSGRRLEDHRFASEDLDGHKHPVMLTPKRPSRHSFGPVRIPKGHYFVMGDNRDNSADSRYFGLVAREAIVGQALRIVLSWDGSILNPRIERFLKKLV